MGMERPLEEILKSWDRCARAALSPMQPIPLLKLANSKLQERLEKNALLISAFVNVVNRVSCKITGDYMFLLTDTDGVLLKIEGNKYILYEVHKSGIKTGMFFTEESVGTNAISLAIKLKEPVYITLDDHYCALLKRWYCYAMPIWLNNKLVGYFDVSTIEQTISGELIVIAELMCDNIVKELEATIQEPVRISGKNIKLTEKQLQVLKLLSQGLTEKAIGLEMGISMNGVKYHKKKILELSDVHCINEALVKAVRLKLLS